MYSPVAEFDSLKLESLCCLTPAWDFANNTGGGSQNNSEFPNQVIVWERAESFKWLMVDECSQLGDATGQRGCDRLLK